MRAQILIFLVLGTLILGRGARGENLKDNQIEKNKFLDTKNVDFDLEEGEDTEDLEDSVDEDNENEDYLDKDYEDEDNHDGTLRISDHKGVGRRFDGIGGLSGGGATSKLLVNYPKEQRDEILDILFKPGYAASLQILKVEIGGDDQSTDGGEASHQHTEDDLNFNRGYEWWLIKEAKKRNKNILLSALPWAFPGWVGEGTQNPYHNRTKTAEYVTRWLKGAREEHNIELDYIGIWNERYADLDYVLILRRTLDAWGFKNVKIITDDGFLQGEAYDSYTNNKTLNHAVWGFGVHYPGTHVSQEGIDSGKPLWSSEDYSTFNDDVGAGCWARILNQNYVNGYMTSTIAWNLIASYYKGMPFEANGLMTAIEPWSGHYEIKNPIWVTAHYTLFTEVGWSYLLHERGVGHLPNNGSYVALTCPKHKELTLIIETMSHNHSICVRPELDEYTIEKQTVTFSLGGNFKRFAKHNIIRKLYIWRSQLKFDGSQTTMFEYMGKVKVDRRSRSFTLDLDVDSIYTVTSVKRKPPKVAGSIPKSAPFPLPYEADWNDQPVNSDPFLLTSQTGMWEVLHDDDLKTNFIRQMVPIRPVAWCGSRHKPIAIIGDSTWWNNQIDVKVRVPRQDGVDAIFLALRTNAVGCYSEFGTRGLFAWFYLGTTKVAFSTNFNQREHEAVHHAKRPFTFDTVHSISMQATYNATYIEVDNEIIAFFFLNEAASEYTGFAGIGSSGFGQSDWFDLKIKKTQYED